MNAQETMPRCSHCGRSLMDPESVQRGIGPDCQANVGRGIITVRDRLVNAAACGNRVADAYLAKLDARKRLTPSQRMWAQRLPDPVVPRSLVAEAANE